MRLLCCLVLLLGSIIGAYGAVSEPTWRAISNINREGPYIGIVVPNPFELNPLLQSPSFVADHKFPYLDFAGNLLEPCVVRFFDYTSMQTYAFLLLSITMD